MSTRERRRRGRAAIVLFATATAALASNTAFGGKGSLTLERAIAMSLDSPALRAGRESINQARADARTASLIPNPSVGVEVGMLPLSRRYSVEEPGGPPDLSAGISYPIDWLLFGKRAANMRSAEAAIGVAELEYADLIRQRISETTEAFYDVLEAQALLEVARAATGSLEQVEISVAAAVANGGRPQVELSRVRLEAQSARREERSARSALIAARANLRALLGAADEIHEIEIAGTLDGPLTVKPLSVEESLEIARENRPDLLALQKKREQAQREAVAEGRNAWPETTIGFGVARQFQESIGAPDVTGWGASIEVALPLFDRNQGNRDKAASVADQCADELEAALSDLRAEMEQAVQELTAALEIAAEAAQTELELASQVRDSFKKAFEAGGRSFVELIDAERSYRETYRAYISSRADYWRSLARYEVALGRKVSS
jgi:cobalt-zinc-cadmium efflux system outer membrane protein